MGEISTYQDLVDAIDRMGSKTRSRPTVPPAHAYPQKLYDLYLDQPRYVTFLAYPLILRPRRAYRRRRGRSSRHRHRTGHQSPPAQPTLNRLTTHPHASVRIALASNSNLTPKECQALAEDENTYVRATSQPIPACPAPTVPPFGRLPERRPHRSRAP